MAVYKTDSESLLSPITDFDWHFTIAPTVLTAEPIGTAPQQSDRRLWFCRKHFPIKP